MSFKILLPLSVPAELAHKKLEDLKGLEKHTIVLNNWDNFATKLAVEEFAARGAEAYDCTYNLGLAASWNFGMQRMIEDNNDFVIILSASAVFDKDIRYFIDAIKKEEEEKHRWRYICGQASLHCFAHTKMGVEQGGYLDENFYPIYLEDTDYCWRSQLHDKLGLCTAKDRVKNINRNEIVHSYDYSVACKADARLLSLYQHNANRQLEYYIKKWGGYQGSEVYETPFNNPNLKVNDWTIDKGFWHHAYPNQKWTPPKPTVRY